MNAILTFFNENSTYIAIIIGIIISLLVYISFNNIDLNKMSTKKLTQTVTVETFGTMDNGTGLDTGLGANSPQDTDFSGPNSFCETYAGNSPGLNVACKDLTDENCSSTSCCVLVKGQNGNTCTAGDVDGPTFNTDASGNMISTDSYYYAGKSYSSGGISLNNELSRVKDFESGLDDDFNKAKKDIDHDVNKAKKGIDHDVNKVKKGIEDVFHKVKKGIDHDVHSIKKDIDHDVHSIKKGIDHDLDKLKKSCGFKI
jgi:hypothetical protein